MDFTDAELLLILRALDKKIWAMDHVGMADNDPRKTPFLELRARIVAEHAGRTQRAS